ncbi:putative 2-aminoethylphosphonate ABC transporter substrate-binding protein [Herbaspirillum sp. RTI4]|uniref:putative 2-aminoethylphosphonate ABC transporter substrate-binding protein n=1 Tax=Herbaspirillum sp. RTI4 TaxID=3048640 RepID=UPI002AB5D1D1|nr:putative 2-aminoethylphosphonate ABC transporter substrate-binding protein [Herbaspirillum sp. RTI4]MDY7577664.1 putative 2-aminoethylphosphonate ABC transporter substrate-binding protein [Herbaspirillum sp. RTI4]MEA9982170.1 putative 2-aminoethylphosphonate ABC transporter substrate-binding protein [Herbaspirillum sp. RTI4]
MQISTLLKTLPALLCLTTTLASAESSLTVYTALEADQIKAYQHQFETEYPDIKIRWVRDSTGIITAKLLAEKAAPQADVIMGVAVTSLLVLEKEGMLQGYAPKGVEKLTKRYVDDATPPNWVGMDVWGATICFNTVEAAKQGLKKPESWKDLLKPEYKGKIVMPNPASSGTGYFDVSGWLTQFGEKDGWTYMDQLHNNIAQYTHSGSKPCKQAASGEFPIGIAFEYRGAKLKESGAPIDLIFPKEGLGWDVEATAIMKGTKNLEAARKLADWSASKSANEQFANNFAIVAYPGVAKPNPLIPANYEQMLIKQNLKWAAANRDRILAEWTKRYDGKSEPK